LKNPVHLINVDLKLVETKKTQRENNATLVVCTNVK